MSLEEERLQIQDNLNEFLTNYPQIKNITFVFAHPDDIEGYAGGLVNRLAGINASRKPEERYSLNFVVVTDGANGTKDTTDRAELVRTRQQEQLEGLKVLFSLPEEPEQLISTQQGQHNKYKFNQSNSYVTFLNHQDSNVDQERLVNELEVVLAESGGDLIITHDTREWGRPVSEKNPYLAVQNHSDHRAIAKSVSNLLAKLEDAGVEDIPILLRATWEASDISAGFDGNTKKAALTKHESQFHSGSEEIDQIVDDLNTIESERFEFYELVNPNTEFKKNIRRTLISIAGEQARILINPKNLLSESFNRFSIKKILLLGETSKETWVEPNIDVIKLTSIFKEWDRNIFEAYIRNNNIDFLVIPADLPDNIREDIHAVMMFLSSVSHEGFEKPNTHKIKGAAYAMEGREGNDLGDFIINIGRW